MEEASRPQIALQFYISKGLKPWQAAGLVGTFMQESGSGLNPSAIGDNGSAFGIYQARGDRFNLIKNVAKKRGTSWKDFQTQLEASWIDLTTRETYSYNKLRSAKNIEQAAEAAIAFERPIGWSRQNPRNGHGWKNRLAFAKSLAGSAGSVSKEKPAGKTDPAAKDDAIPVKDRNPMDVANELDFSDEGDFGFGEETEDEGMEFDPLFSDEEEMFAEDDSDILDFLSDPPGPIVEDTFGAYWPQETDGLGIPDPPPPPPEFGDFVQIPDPPTTFRDRVLGITRRKEEDV